LTRERIRNRIRIMDKEYKNKAEREFAETAEKNGWRVTKRGYPDFICYRGDDLMLVEVKGKPGRKLKRTQHSLMRILKRKYGVKCFRWTPSVGFSDY